MASTQTFPATASAVAEARRFIRQVAAEHPIPPEDVRAIVLAVSEAFTNAVLHTDSKEVRVGLRAVDDRVEAWVQDEGIFRFDSPAKTRGWGGGLALLASVVDEVSIKLGTKESPGTSLQVAKYRVRP